MSGPGEPGGGVDPALLARLLRQREELGAPPLFLDDTVGGDLLADARRLLEGSRAVKHDPGSSAAGGGRAGARRSSSRIAQAAPDGAEEGALPAAYARLRESALTCTKCGLAEGRTQVVFSDGVATARVVVVGEAPGANEDRTGLPFVGPAGKLLDLMLASVGLSRRENTYICNVIKCRPPGNRNPLPEEIEACAPYLLRQIELIEPEVILGVGTFAARWLTGTTLALGRLRGEVHSYRGVPAVVTYHPAALLRNRGWTRATWDDLQLLRQILDGA